MKAGIAGNWTNLTTIWIHKPLFPLGKKNTHIYANINIKNTFTWNKHSRLSAQNFSTCSSSYPISAPRSLATWQRNKLEMTVVIVVSRLMCWCWNNIIWAVIKMHWPAPKPQCHKPKSVPACLPACPPRRWANSEMKGEGWGQKRAKGRKE